MYKQQNKNKNKNNKTKSLTFMRHKTYKQPKPKIVRTANPKCALHM